MGIILVVDSDRLVVGVIRRALEREGHTVYAAMSASEAYRLAERTESFDALIVDHWVPRELGGVIAQHVLTRHAQAKVLHISGYPRGYLEEQGWFLPGAAFLGKPFGMEQIQRCVAALLDCGRF